jgi:hypothetical protein
MERMECLPLTEDDLDDDPVLSYKPAQLCNHEATHARSTEYDLDDDPVLSYTLAQLCHHEAAHVLLSSPPPEGTKRQI